MLAGCEGGAFGHVFGLVVASVPLPGFMRVLRRQVGVPVLLEAGVEDARVAGDEDERQQRRQNPHPQIRRMGHPHRKPSEKAAPPAHRIELRVGKWLAFSRAFVGRAQQAGAPTKKRQLRR
jgi:hypothetical protein